MVESQGSHDLLWKTPSTFPLAAMVVGPNARSQAALCAALRRAGVETSLALTVGKPADHQSLQARRRLCQRQPAVHRHGANVASVSPSNAAANVIVLSASASPSRSGVATQTRLAEQSAKALMPMIQNRLAYHRVPSPGLAVCLWESRSVVGEVVNLSLSGLLLRAPQLPMLKARVSLLLSVDHSQVALTVAGTVVRTTSIIQWASDFLPGLRGTDAKPPSLSETPGCTIADGSACRSLNYACSCRGRWPPPHEIRSPSAYALRIAVLGTEQRDEHVDHIGSNRSPLHRPQLGNSSKKRKAALYGVGLPPCLVPLTVLVPRLRERQADARGLTLLGCAAVFRTPPLLRSPTGIGGVYAHPMRQGSRCCQPRRAGPYDLCPGRPESPSACCRCSLV